MEIILTEHGRKKLGQGKFRPIYFAFADDEIDYQTPNRSQLEPVASIVDPSEIAGYEFDYDGGSFAEGVATDISGNGRDLSTQAGTVAQVSRAGQLALSFDGASWLGAQFAAPIAQPVTVYSVWEATNASSGVIVSASNLVTNRYLTYIFSSAIRAFLGVGLAGGAPVAGTVYGSSVVANGAVSELYGLSDFATPGDVGDVGANAVEGIRFGASGDGAFPFTGYIWRVIGYSGVHSLATRREIGRFLSKRYGITIAT